ncbi:MAG: purine-nucleoside phosphorylase [Verrucomicrobia bacterium]|nr:purine-nucleoside phosphorylase [Verrucomicrobiota bacterium]
MNELVAKSVAQLRRRLPEATPELAIVLGSGHSGVQSRLKVAAEIRYEKLRGFPVSQVQGHAGKLLFGRMSGVPVLLLCGRSHFYEGLSMSDIAFPIRVLAQAGIRTLVLTNAAGGINPRFRVGDFMCLSDHINFMGANPLRGESVPHAPSFLDLSQVYDPRLIRLVQAAARSVRIRLHRGIYVAVSGPSYETPAEIKVFARLGADAVGMSTVPEAIVARECGLRVAAISCITNLAAGRTRSRINHAEVLAMGAKAQTQMSDLLSQFVELYSRAAEAR